MKTAKFLIATLALTLILGATTAQAQAQFVAMYSEVFKEDTGALEYKEWSAANGHIRQEHADGGVTIVRLDSMTIYRLDPAKKTASAISLSQFGDPNRLAGRVVQTGHSEKRETVETGVDVGGYSCDHIVVTIQTSNADGSTGGGTEQMWWHEPLKTWIRYGSGQFTHGQTSIRRNIVPGPQPSHLFEIPRDYAISRMPSGGLMEMMTGKQQTGEQKQQTMTGDDLLDIITGGQGDAALKLIQGGQK
jgi:hypothetical protein